MRVDSHNWREKVNPLLLKKYDDASTEKDRLEQNVVVEYRGNFNELPKDIEILSAMDDQLQISIPLMRLPFLASLSRTKSLKLPFYVRADIE